MTRAARARPRPRPGRAAGRRAARAAASAGALAGLAAPAAACPYCAFSQSADTLVFIACFLLVPYAVVYGVWFWIRRVTRAEGEEEA